MPIQHSVAGPVVVTFNAIQLGYSRDGASIRIEPRWIDVPSDDFGGASGAPSDAQFVGAIASVSVDLTKYEAADVRRLTSFAGTSGSAGVFPSFGTLMRQDLITESLLLDGVNEDWVFATAFVRAAIEVNKGTRFSTFNLGFECWINSAQSRQLFTIT